MPKLFIKAEVNGSAIYIKVDSTIIESLFDILHDNGYTIRKVSPNIWDYFIAYGKSYEIDDMEEVWEFEENNIKVNKIKA